MEPLSSFGYRIEGRVWNPSLRQSSPYRFLRMGTSEPWKIKQTKVDLQMYQNRMLNVNIRTDFWHISTTDENFIQSERSYVHIVQFVGGGKFSSHVTRSAPVFHQPSPLPKRSHFIVFYATKYSGIIGVFWQRKKFWVRY